MDFYALLLYTINVAKTLWYKNKLSKEQKKRSRDHLTASLLYALIAVGYFVLRTHHKFIPDDYRYVSAAIFGFLVWKACSRFSKFLHIILKEKTDYGTAGLGEFVVKLLGLIVAIGLMLSSMGLEPKNLLLGGVITSAVFILTAREPLGNLVAGIMLFSSRPFRVGDHIRIQGGSLAGNFDGTVVQLGLMFTAVQTSAAQATMIPNNLLISSAITPLDQIPAVSFDITIKTGIAPSVVEEVLQYGITVPLKGKVEVVLKNIDREIVVNVSATPQQKDQTGILTDQMLNAIQPLTNAEDWFGTREYAQILPGAVLQKRKESQKNGLDHAETAEH